MTQREKSPGNDAGEKRNNAKALKSQGTDIRKISDPKLARVRAGARSPARRITFLNFKLNYLLKGNECLFRQYDVTL